jgi:hypothetical protein
MGVKYPQKSPKDVKAAEAIAQAALSLTEPSHKLTWDAFKEKVFQFFGGLIMEEKDGKYVISVGRTAWWMAFLPAVAIWVSSGGSLDAGEALKDISPNHYNILVVLAGYNFGKHMVSGAQKILQRKSRPHTENDGPG